MSGDGLTSQPDAARAAPVSRKPNLIVLGVSSMVLVLSTLAASAGLTDAEVAVFRAANDLPQGLYTVVWPVCSTAPSSRSPRWP
jgi:hypothetical protein